MPSLDPDAADRARCAKAGHGHLYFVESEPDNGVVGFERCEDCGTVLWTDPDPRQPRPARREYA